jgi:hypothetical protein
MLGCFHPPLELEGSFDQSPPPLQAPAGPAKWWTKKEIPPKEGLVVVLHRIIFSVVFRVPKLDENFKNKLFIKNEKIMADKQ